MKNVFCFLFPILTLFLGYYNAQAQIRKTTNSFLLKGTINADTGTVLLLPTGGKDFDPNTTNNYKAKIKQGRFTFEGQMAYPCSFIIAFFPSYISSPFIIESGIQHIVCTVNSVREIPKINNRSMSELETAPVNFFSLLTYSADRRAILLNYIKQYPNSYVALWETVRQLDSGYMPVLDSIYNAFSTLLKSSYTGKAIAHRLKATKVTAIGQDFPTLSLLDTNKKPISIPSMQKSKYILIDFWYARCTACLVEFPKLKEIFDSYKDKGFNITGVSIDKQVDIKLWKNVIKERELTWDQYLDLAGKQTVNELFINSFPSNFLLNEKGTIVKRNIRPVELSKFLSENL